MDLNFDELLPRSLSDKEACAVVTFVMEFALALESHYFAQMRNYHQKIEKQYMDEDKSLF